MTRISWWCGCVYDFNKNHYSSLQVGPGRLTCKHFIDCASQTPNIGIPIVTRLSYYFGRHPVWSSCQSFVLSTKHLARAEVSQLTLPVFFHQNIRSFDIAVDYVFKMEVFKSLQNLFGVNCHYRFPEAALFLKKIFKCPARNKF